MSDIRKYNFISMRNVVLTALLVFAFYSACGDDDDESNDGYICSEYSYEVTGECETDDDCSGDAFCDGEQCLLLIEEEEEEDGGDAETDDAEDESDATVDDEEPATSTESDAENEIIILEVCQAVESDSCIHW